MIKAEILGNPEYAALLAAEDWNGIADLFNSKKLLTGSRFITAKTILAECKDGAALLDKLVSIGSNISAVKWAVSFLLADSGLDIGHPKTQAMISFLASQNLISVEEETELHNMAIIEVSEYEIRKALSEE